MKLPPFSKLSEKRRNLSLLLIYSLRTSILVEIPTYTAMASCLGICRKLCTNKNHVKTSGLLKNTFLPDIDVTMSPSYEHLSQLMRLWYLSHRRSAKDQASLLFAHMNYENRRRVRPNIRCWMTAHARLKNEFTEDAKSAIIS